VYSIDSNANAVVLSDIGNAEIQGNNKGWFSISFTQHRVVHILNKNGYDEADVVIPLYTNGTNEERVDDIKAVTYNLENGKIVESKLDKSGVFKEKIDVRLIHKKFTLPNVKEGCIIEYQYTVTSDFIQNLDPWTFQGSSPVLWSEYNLSVPQFFTYAFLSHGYQPFYLSEHKDRQSNFTVVESGSATSSDRYNFTSGVTDYRWVMKDVPELKKESYTSTVKNHIARLEFQLSSQSDPLQPHDYRNTWTGLTKDLLESEYFGKGLNNGNGWMSDEVKPLITGATTDVDKAKKIYAYVRDNFTCTGHSGISTDQSLKNIFKTRKGTVSEINLLLTAMLRYAGLTADPVILSTRGHGYILELYPMITSFNYVVSKFSIGDKDYFLDASYSRLGFGRLTEDCYNGHARIVNDEATPVVFSPDSVLERKVTSLIISNDDNGKWVGTVNQTNGYFESYEDRNKIKENGKEEFFKEIQKQYGQDAKISSPEIDSLTMYEDPVTLRYTIDMSPKEDILYVNPMFGERYKKNPFASAQRVYPVEMPYKIDEIFVLTMEIPKGYEVDELPKQMRAKLDEQGSASFEYVLAQTGTTISMRSRIKINRTLFLPDEYDLLREFFNMVVKKQNEQIVFKKKK
ncbi:MAG: transglutaminase domain-containing protein, partial [Flavisolibacter sp.]